MNTTEVVVEIRPEKKPGPHGIWTYDLYDTGAALYQQLSQQANWKEGSLIFVSSPQCAYMIFIYLQSVLQNIPEFEAYNTTIVVEIHHNYIA